MVTLGHVNVQQHPQFPDLFIYNYAPSVQYDKVWNEATRMCRGLILDNAMNIVARPFPKFFNYEEHKPEEIPNESFDIFEKLDGSLGILYWAGDKPYIATRGSFTSDQAMKATKILHEKHPDSFYKLRKDRTYLFEIIYPENRIVVDYGNAEAIVLLAIIDNATGKDLPLEYLGFGVNKRINGLKLSSSELLKLKENNLDNSEGFVILFESGMRVKVKFNEYVRLHRILTGVSTVTIWEYLSSGRKIEDILDKVPDEFYDWVKKVTNKLESEFLEIDTICRNLFKKVDHIGSYSRKEHAEWIMKCEYPSVLFKMLDEKPYHHIIWKLIRPAYQKPFKVEA